MSVCAWNKNCPQIEKCGHVINVFTIRSLQTESYTIHMCINKYFSIEYKLGWYKIIVRKINK